MFGRVLPRVRLLTQFSQAPLGILRPQEGILRDLALELIYPARAPLIEEDEIAIAAHVSKHL
jgi:hypothetical protein